MSDVDPSKFVDPSAGSVVPTLDGAFAFVPAPLPPKLDLSPLIPLMQKAAMHLGEVNGIGRTLPNPYLLIAPFQRREAVASSNIEGTVTQLSDLFLFEEGAEEQKRPPDTREVFNYVQALQTGIDRLKQLPICLRLIRDIHSVLLSNVTKHRGANVRPGEFRTEQNWIGGRTAKTARFVPPPVSHLSECLKNFESFLNADHNNVLSPLTKTALLHYQFEAIHPFPDGNGRLGRLVIPLYLYSAGYHPQPLLYMSSYFERNKDDYIDRLYDVSTRGDWLGWIEFFLNGVVEQCVDTAIRIKKLQDIQVRYKEKVGTARSSAHVLRLVDILFERPFVSIPRTAETLGVTYRSAHLNIQKLVDHAILTELSENIRPKFFWAPEIFDIIHSDIPSEAAESSTQS